jgi:hypothetical protein
MLELSSTATSIITLLNNINDLIVQSSDRQGARDVMRSIKVYAKNMNFPIPEDQVDNFLEVLIDSKPYTLTSIIKDIARAVVVADRKTK